MNTLEFVSPYQMTVNRSDLDWRHIQDILSTSKNNNQYDNENLLKRHLCRVVLDFQLGSIQNYSTINPSSFLYTQKWDISFTKYAKKTLKAIFQNKTIPVGVLYNEAQLDKKQSKISEILRLQEIQFADFAYVNLEYSPVIRMPLDFILFWRNLYYLREKNDKYLTQRDSKQGNLTYDSVDAISIQVEYMFSWRSGFSMLDQFQFDKSSHKKVLQASNHEYLALFQEYVQTVMSLESSTIGVISGSIFNAKQVASKLSFSEQSSARHILPTMYIQEADANTCDMLEMLSHLSKPNHDAVVVNEFTWSSLAKNEAVIKEANVTNCINYFPDEIKTPENMLLFVTRGISEHWGTINQTFINLVEDHFSVAYMNLTRIVLSSDDLPEHSESEDPKRPNGMDERRIADETRATTVYDNVSEYLIALADTWKLGTGCVVDFTRENVTQPKKLFELTFEKCSPGYYRIPFFVWKYTINSTELENLLEYGEGHGENVLMRKLFTMVAARQLMKSTAPVIEVVFQIEIEETINLGYKVWNNCWMKSHEEIELEYVLQKWAQIHDVQIIRKQDVSQTPCMMYGF